MEGGIFTSNYVTYEILTDSENWTVRRRYSDFQWLRSILQKFFPGHIVPPLPSKKVGPRRFQEDFIDKRMKFMQKFIEAVLESEYFKSSSAMVTFLSLDNRNTFEAKMKEMNAIKPSNFIEDIRTFDGKVKIVDNAENEKYFTNISNFFSLTAQLMERINYSLKGFYINLNNACINLEEIETDFKTLDKLNKRVFMVSYD